MLGLELGLQIRQLGSGRDHVQVVERGFVDIDLVLLAERPAGQALLEEVGDAHGDIVAGQASQVLGRVGLGIQVDQQGPITFAGAHRRQVASDARLAHTTFLIEHHAPHD
ncbi:hypothetical protein D3C75_1080040 [compost metagenome]